jgi:hypothetical protein
MDELMRINGGYALADCDFSVYARRRSVPLVHDLLTNIADSIVVCTGTKAGNGNIVYRAAHGALKFVYGILPRLRHHANMRQRRTDARLNTVQ